MTFATEDSKKNIVRILCSSRTDPTNIVTGLGTTTGYYNVIEGCQTANKGYYFFFLQSQLTNWLSMSTGTGKMMVEFFSADRWVSVWR